MVRIICVAARIGTWRRASILPRSAFVADSSPAKFHATRTASLEALYTLRLQLRPIWVRTRFLLALNNIFCNKITMPLVYRRKKIHSFKYFGSTHLLLLCLTRKLATKNKSLASFIFCPKYPFLT